MAVQLQACRGVKLQTYHEPSPSVSSCGDPNGGNPNVGNLNSTRIIISGNWTASYNRLSPVVVASRRLQNHHVFSLRRAVPRSRAGPETLAILPRRRGVLANCRPLQVNVTRRFETPWHGVQGRGVRVTALQNNDVRLNPLQSSTDTSREDCSWQEKILRRFIALTTLYSGSSSSINVSSSSSSNISSSKEFDSRTAVESIQEPSGYNVTAQNWIPSNRDDEFSRLWEERRTRRRRGGGRAGRGDGIWREGDNQRVWFPRDGDYVERIGDYMERIADDVEKIGDECVKEIGEGVRQQIRHRRRLFERRRRRGSSALGLSDLYKSPLEKAVDSVSDWFADVSASVAESVPPTMDKARRVLTTQIAALPARLHQMLPPRSAPLPLRLALLLSSSLLLLCLLLRTSLVARSFQAASAAVRSFFAPVLWAVSPEEVLQQQEEEAERNAQQQQQEQEKAARKALQQQEQKAERKALQQQQQQQQQQEEEEEEETEKEEKKADRKVCVENSKEMPAFAAMGSFFAPVLWAVSPEEVLQQQQEEKAEQKASLQQEGIANRKVSAENPKLTAAAAAVHSFFAPVLWAVGPEEVLLQQEEKAEQKSLQQRQQQQQQQEKAEQNSLQQRQQQQQQQQQQKEGQQKHSRQQQKQQQQQQQEQTGSSGIGETGSSAFVMKTVFGFSGGYAGLNGGVEPAGKEAEDIHRTMLALEMSQVDTTERSGESSGERAGRPAKAPKGMGGVSSQSGKKFSHHLNQCNTGSRVDRKAVKGQKNGNGIKSDLIPDWWRDAWSELALQLTQRLVTGSTAGSGAGAGSGQAGVAGSGGASVKDTRVAVMGALEQFNSQGHIPADALIQIWAAWRASGDTWHTQRDSVRLIVFNAAVQLALDECIGSHQPPKLPTSGPSFIVAMAEAVSLAPPAALAAALRGVASRVAAELVACNELLEESMRGKAEVKLQQISKLLSEFTPALVAPELASSANLLREMLSQREREELAWMYERAAGPKHAALVKRVLGL